MSARDFINETLLTWLEEEITIQAKGSQHCSIYRRGLEDDDKLLPWKKPRDPE